MDKKKNNITNDLISLVKLRLRKVYCNNDAGLMS